MVPVEACAALLYNATCFSKPPHCTFCSQQASSRDNAVYADTSRSRTAYMHTFTLLMQSFRRRGVLTQGLAACRAGAQ